MSTGSQKEPAVERRDAPAPREVCAKERKPARARPGEHCPQCGEGILDYDGLLNLVCPLCHFSEGGCFT